MATDLSIRSATAADSEAIQALHRQAFGEEEGETIARLVADLQTQPSVLPTLSLVAEVGGHEAFVYGSPVYQGRFGFTAQRPLQFLTPCPLKFPSGWQSQPLIVGIQKAGDAPV